MSFLRVGLFGFGGGPSMIPLVHQEVVKRHAWMNNDAFADVLAIGNTLPGPIATKMAGYIGYRVGGVLGAVNAVFAVTVPVIVVMIVLLTLYAHHGDQQWVTGMGKGVIPVVMVMMARLTLDFFNNSRASLGWGLTLVLGSLSGVLIYGFDIHPGWVVGSILVAALFRPEQRGHEKEANS